MRPKTLPAPGAAGAAAATVRRAPAHGDAAAPGPLPGWLYRVLAIGMTGLVYTPILFNYFHADDFYYLYLLNDHRPLEFLLTPHGGHMLLVRNAAYALCHALFGTDPRGYFALMLITHVANVLLLFALIRALTASDRLACLGAALWGMCPVNEGSLGWYAVYGHVLATTLVLAVLLHVVRAGRNPAAAPWWEPTAWYLALLLASMSFGVGMAVAMVFPAVLLLLLPAARFRVPRLLFWSLPPAVVGLYALLLWSYDVVSSRLDPVAFGLADTARQLWWIIPPTAIHLVNVGVSSLLLGPFAPNLPYPSPLAYAVAVAFYAGALALVVSGGAAARRQVLAFALVAGSAYAMIALGRGPLMPSFGGTPASVAAWPRYQYLGTFPLAVVACLILRWLSMRWTPPERWRDPLLGLWAALTAAAYVHSGHRIEHFGDDRAGATAFLDSVHTLVEGRRATDGPLYIRNRVFPPIGYMGFESATFPGWAAAFIAYFPDDSVNGTRVFFVEPDEATIAEIRNERTATRTAHLLVTDDERGDAAATP